MLSRGPSRRHRSPMSSSVQAQTLRAAAELQQQQNIAALQQQQDERERWRQQQAAVGPVPSVPVGSGNASHGDEKT